MTDPAVRCSDWARDHVVAPGGTAGWAKGYLLVDWPLPWISEVSEISALAPVGVAASSAQVRLQLVVPIEDAQPLTVELYHRSPSGDGWFDGYRRRARDADNVGHLIETALDLITSMERETDHSTPDRAVLVCSHGARDRCCGSTGTPLALSAIKAGLPVRRTSHLGGHRFAPTGLVLPDGMAWAHMDGDMVRRLLSRQGSVEDLLPRYRGCSALGSRRIQTAECVPFGEIGWDWLGYRRRGSEADDGSVLIEAVSPAGRELAWRVEVEPMRELPVPACGEPISRASKVEFELAARRQTREPLSRDRRASDA